MVALNCSKIFHIMESIYMEDKYVESGCRRRQQDSKEGIQHMSLHTVWLQDP
jgi:hypothetical protein